MDANYSLGLVSGLATIAAVKYGYLYWMKRRRDDQFVRVGKVEGLNLYPVKSCAGFSVDSAECTRLGLRAQNIPDRQWMVSKNGTFITQRQDGRLALITAQPVDGQLVLSAPNMPDLKLAPRSPEKGGKTITCRLFYHHLSVHDCGPGPATWIRKYLQEENEDLRIVQYSPEVTQRDIIGITWPMNLRPLPDDQSAFGSYCSYMLATDESLEDLNTRLDTAVEMKNFRPNIVISGSAAWREDEWEEVRIGRTRFRFLSSCDRCAMTTIDTQTGKRHPTGEPLATLKKFRLGKKQLFFDSPLFGIYLALDQTGVINVGDEVFAIVKESDLKE